MDTRNRGMLVDTPSTVKPHTRRPHRKTKTGCLSCKRRKIKCDEQRPECDNCIKHTLKCEYALKKQVESPGLLTSSNGCSDLNLLDLELFHFFCTVTSLTYHRNPTARKVMSINVPQLGFSHDFVMHGILALAATHMAKIQPVRKDICTDHGSHHHQIGLQKASLILQELDEGNASALYIFTALTLLYTIANSNKSNSESHLVAGDAGLAEWIVLSRQSFSIIRIAGDVLNSGPLAPMFKNGSRRVKLQDEYMSNLVQNEHVQHMARLVDQNTLDLTHKKDYADTVAELIKIYSVVDGLVGENQELETSDIFRWPYKVTNGYLDLLQQGAQEALVILAFFAVLPTRYKDNWFLEDFGIGLISKIYPLIDEAHLPWIQWPLQEVGWTLDQPKVYSM